MKDKIVSFDDVRRARDTDPDQIEYDGNGRIMFKYAIDYKFSESHYSIHIFAYDFADAQSRLAAINATGEVVGQIVSEQPTGIDGITL